MADGKPYTIESGKSLVEGNFSITSTDMAFRFMKDVEAVLEAAFPELLWCPPAFDDDLMAHFQMVEDK